MRQTIDLTYAQSHPVGVKHLGDYCSVPTYSPEALRAKRHIIRDGLQTLVYPCKKFSNPDLETGELRVLSEFRLSVCGRHLAGEQLAIYRNGDVIGTSGLTRCGNAWGCVFCASKVMRARGEQIAEVFESHHASGGTAFMVTYTAASKLTNPLSSLIDQFKDAKRFMAKGRPFRRLIQDVEGVISAFEITYNDRNGWHPHFHDVWFVKPGFKVNAEKMADDLFDLWQSACSVHGLTTLKYFKARRIGVDMRPSFDASEYLTKFNKERDWSLSAEMTAGRLKGSKGGSVTPLTLIELAIEYGRSSKYFDLTLEFLRATKGKQIISLKGAKKLLARLDIPLTFDDYADANKAGEGEIIGYLDKETFYTTLNAGGMGRVLEMARSGNFTAANIQPT